MVRESMTMGQSAATADAPSPGSTTASDDYWSLWQAHQPYFRKLCYQWLNGNSAEIDDALSQACLKAHEAWSLNRAQILHFKAWQRQVLRNVCLDLHRGHTRSASYMNTGQETDDVPLVPMAPSCERPDERLLDDELRATLRRLIDNLPQHLREPIIMRGVQELSYQDIAQRLSLSPATARKRVQAARTVLRLALQRYRTGRPSRFDNRPAVAFK